MTVELLSRLQFAVTIGFHYLFPPLSIGLAVALVAMETLWLATGERAWHRLAHFFTRIFGLTFAIGVATGIVMEFQFGSNWSAYSRFVGDVFGSLLASEGIFAFFLESGFLAVLLFGWDRVRPVTHLVATMLVCFGAHFSAVWIVVANSWMQTPTGFRLVEHAGSVRAETTDFWTMVLNPSSLVRLAHTLCGAWQAGAWLVISVGAWYVLRGRHADVASRALRLGLVLALVASALQAVTGSLSADVVARTQPSKLAAMEGVWPASAPAAAYVAGWVDEAHGSTHGLAIPGLLSWLVHGDTSAPVTGLAAFPPADRPPVNLTFQCYHAMVILGGVALGLSGLGCLAWVLGALERSRWLLRVLVAAVLIPQVANQTGWGTAEVGRQPWLVYGLLRTADGVSPRVQPPQVLASLVLFTAIYALLFAVFVFLLDRKIREGPSAPDDEPSGRRVVPFAPAEPADPERA